MLGLILERFLIDVPYLPLGCQKGKTDPWTKSQPRDSGMRWTKSRISTVLWKRLPSLKSLLALHFSKWHCKNKCFECFRYNSARFCSTFTSKLRFKFQFERQKSKFDAAVFLPAAVLPIPKIVSSKVSVSVSLSFEWCRRIRSNFTLKTKLELQSLGHFCAHFLSCFFLSFFLSFFFSLSVFF